MQVKANAKLNYFGEYKCTYDTKLANMYYRYVKKYLLMKIYHNDVHSYHNDQIHITMVTKILSEDDV